mmetsp:Transcript_6956/g.7638  ORF Transcript_6956/g.7638 Transcript_6956/m.7638 type:complete len:120 (-) Transcript_6956:144-503(-)
MSYNLKKKSNNKSRRMRMKIMRKGKKKGIMILIPKKNHEVDGVYNKSSYDSSNNVRDIDSKIVVRLDNKVNNSFAITNVNTDTNADADDTYNGTNVDCFIFNHNQPDVFLRRQGSTTAW